MQGKKPKYDELLKKKKKGVNALLVSTFYDHFYFDPYIFILLFLVLKMKNAFHFGPYRHSLNGRILRGKRNALLAQ